MTEKQYQKISTFFADRKRAGQLVVWCNRIGTSLVYVIYPVLLGSLILQRDGRFWREFFVPCIAFLLLTFVRARVNAPRPYEVYDYTPLIQKDTKGNSFPSRHVFSAFVIAMGGLYVNALIGGILLFLGTMIAICRVLGGVHFPKDVLVGALAGVLSGAVGFWLI
jgi:membrane-associated phospholipid phosphatase